MGGIGSGGDFFGGMRGFDGGGIFLGSGAVMFFLGLKPHGPEGEMRDYVVVLGVHPV